MRSVRIAALIALTVFATLGIRSALGTPISGGSVARHATQIKTSFSNISATASWVDPWRTVTTRKVVVPKGTKAVFDVRFSGEGQCLTAGTGHCWARVKIAGAVVEHESLFAIAYSSDPGRSLQLYWERASHVLKPGTYKVAVQISSDGTAYTQAEVDYWHLTVERIIV